MNFNRGLFIRIIWRRLFDKDKLKKNTFYLLFFFFFTIFYSLNSLVDFLTVSGIDTTFSSSSYMRSWTFGPLTLTLIINAIGIYPWENNSIKKINKNSVGFSLSRFTTLIPPPNICHLFFISFHCFCIYTLIYITFPLKNLFFNFHWLFETEINVFLFWNFLFLYF